MKADNVIRISTSLNGKFFKHWFSFLEPFHKLTDKEMDVIACFAKHRYELSKKVKDDTIISSLLISKDIRDKVREECNLAIPYFQVILSRLKKSKIFVEGNIHPKFIPHIEEGSDSLNLLIKFELNGK